MVTNLIQSKTFKDLIQQSMAKAIEGKLCSLTQHIERQEARFFELENTIEQREAQCKTISEHIDSLNNLQQLQSSNLIDLEQYSRQNNIRIFGLPEHQGENTNEVVKKLAVDNLEITIPDASIDRSHRVGRQRSEGNRGILVKFLFSD